MKVEIIDATDNPRKLACKAARNDYLEQWIGEMSYSEIMEDVKGDTIKEKEENLLRKLIKRQHFGVFEHLHCTFQIKGMSRVVMAQATRHRHLSWDIQSQRYVDFSDPDYTIPPSFVEEEHVTRDDGVVEDKTKWRNFYEDSVEYAVQDYRDMVVDDVPKEDARYILPTAMQVNAVMSGNLRALMHVVNMRTKANVQKETRDFANGVSEEIEDWCPMIHEIFDEQMPMKLGL